MSIHAFPRQLTTFVGRERETTAVVAQLQQPACRLLTLVGPGGIGKTRLAIQVGMARQTSFEASYFVALQAIDTPEQLLYAIADVLGIALVDSDPLAQLVNHLQDAATLLILDNFEQLLDAAALVADLIYATPQLKLLITSREVLNLQEEWVYPVEGLSLPDDPGVDDKRFDAARLFIERARRVDPHFEADPQANPQIDDIVTICRLVGGTPLAIELAATWARSLTCAAIADEIRASLHFLTSHQRNIPERHQSMRAVIDRSWNFLSPAEQTTLRRLAVFQGDFKRAAAEAIALATLPILTALVDKSLVRVATQGRYQLHELVRQYAWEKLAEHETAGATASGAEMPAASTLAKGGEKDATRRRHAEFYLSNVAQLRSDIVNSQHLTAVKTISAEYENVRAAWYTAIEQMLFDALRLAADPLQQFFDYQARFVEATELLGAAHEAVAQALTGDVDDAQTARLALARLGAPYGWALLRLGRLHEAADCLRTSQRIYDEMEMAPPKGFGTDPICALAFVIFLQGDYATALELAESSHDRLAQIDDAENLSITYYVLGGIHAALGQYDQAVSVYQLCYALALEMGNRWYQAYMLVELGKLALVRGNYDQAQHYYASCYTLKEICEDEQGQAIALAYLANLALRRGDADAARDIYDRSEAIYRRIHDRGGLIMVLQGQCEVALFEGDLHTALQALREATQVVQQTNLLPIVLSLLVTSVGVLCRLEADEPCVELLTLVIAHPACDDETRRQAHELMTTLGLSVEQPPALSAPEDALGWDALMGLVNQIQTRVSPHLHASAHAPTNGAAGIASPRPRDPADEPNQALVEPLTERELEVLGLLAHGLSNQAIADELIIAVGTVKSYTSHIYGKLAVANRTQAIVQARKLGIL